MKKSEISRQQIIGSLKDKLENNSSVFALWLEGSDANGTVDQYSDIDIWVDVKDGEEDSVFNKIHEILIGLGDLNFSYSMKHPNPQIHQKVFHLKNTPESLLVDVCIQSHGRNFEFTRGLDDEPKIIFDKGSIKFKDLDREQFQKELQERIDHIKQVFAQKIRVLTKVKRGDFLEALMYYNKWIIAPLTELLRIQYIPRKKDYHFKHVGRDLPKEVTEQLEILCRVTSVKDIERGVVDAEKLFKKTLDKLKN